MTRAPRRPVESVRSVGAFTLDFFINGLNIHLHAYSFNLHFQYFWLDVFLEMLQPFHSNSLKLLVQ